MSSCFCYYGTEMLGGRISKVQTARKPGYHCATCGGEVFPGQKCVDIAGLDCDGGGFFCRLHAECHELTQRFQAKVCKFTLWYGGLGGLERLEEAAQHAVAQGDDPFWMEWLELYEQTWKYWEPSPGEEWAQSCEDCIRFGYCESKHGVTRFRLAEDCVRPEVGGRTVGYESLKGLDRNVIEED